MTDIWDYVMFHSLSAANANYHVVVVMREWRAVIIIEHFFGAFKRWMLTNNEGDIVTQS